MARQAAHRPPLGSDPRDGNTALSHWWAPVGVVVALLAIGCSTGDHDAGSDNRRGEDTTASGDATVASGVVASSTSTTTSSSTSSSTTTTAPPPGQRGELGNGNSISIAFGGDSSFTGLDSQLRQNPDGLLSPIAPVLSGADLAIVNLEAALTQGGTPSPKEFNFRVPPEALQSLAAAGVDAVSVANNHGMDYGPSGFAETLAIRDTSTQTWGVAVLGAGHNASDALAPLLVDVAGQRVGVLAATDVLDSSLRSQWTATADKPGLASAKGADEDALVFAVASTSQVADTVVVYLHMGVETDTCPTERQVSLTRRLHEAGADIVIGAHAHRLHGAGFADSGFAAYGLGNYIFATSSVEGRRSGTLVVDVTGRRVDGFRWEPARIDGSVPIPLEGAAAEDANAHFAGLAGCAGLSATPTPPPIPDPPPTPDTTGQDARQ